MEGKNNFNLIKIKINSLRVKQRIMTAYTYALKH